MDGALSQAVAEEVTDAGGVAQAVACDITDYEAVKAGILDVEKHLGPIDILVNVGKLREPNRHIPFAETEP